MNKYVRKLSNTLFLFHRMCVVLVLFYKVSSLHEDKPLLLTSFLDNGNITEARRISSVIHEVIPFSHAGFLTVDRKLGNHLFFWYFPHKSGNAPLLLWLNGGPAYTSMNGLFLQHGPIKIVNTGSKIEEKIVKRKLAWTDVFSIVYVDNPVGTGYSFTESGQKGLRTDQEGYTSDLFEFIVQFFILFPEHKQSEFYIGGQSYAGKYSTCLADRLHKAREKGCEIPLTGLYLAGPMFDAESQTPEYFQYLFAMGVISYSDKIRLIKKLSKLCEDVVSGNSQNLDLVEGGKILAPTLNGITNKDNFITSDVTLIESLKIEKLMNSEIMRKLLHTGSSLKFRYFNVNLFKLFLDDFYDTAKLKLARIMNNYKVLIYNGDFDVIVNSVMIEEGLFATPWKFANEYKLKTNRKFWISQDSGEALGYYSRTGDFCRVVIHGAGHQTAYDKPESTLEMMRAFVQYGCMNQTANFTIPPDMIQDSE